jgi:hypothetical protein
VDHFIRVLTYVQDREQDGLNEVGQTKHHDADKQNAQAFRQCTTNLWSRQLGNHRRHDKQHI